jgi:DNA replication and repair protein RecF
VVVSHVTLRDFRSYASLDLELPAGLVLVTGRNGAGKTNLLEALHVGAQGFSPRTRADAQLVRFGQPAARVVLRGEEGGAPVETDATIVPGESRRLRLNGAALASAEELRTRLAALVFVPDRLAVVKGGPIVRRSYVDRMLGRLEPAQAALPSEYARALSQRNESLRRVRAGVSGRAALDPWTAQVAELGAALDGARAELVSALAVPFAERAGALGLEGASLAYEPDPPTAAALEERLERDLARGTTSLGPHLRDVRIAAGERDLRSFGSQGEQRTAVLALVLAEADLLADRRGTPPLLLLDDVLSELDTGRRRALVEALPVAGQTVVTATGRAALPEGVEPAAHVEVVPGEARLA